MTTGRSWPLAALAGLVLAWPPGARSAAPDVKPLVAQIKAVGSQGEGNVEAARAWRALAKAGPDALPDVLAALDDATPRSANWLRSAAEAIVDRALAGKQKLPADRLEAFVRDTRHQGTARRLAYECLLRVDPTASKRLIPGMLNDPGAELRRDAVELVMAEAERLYVQKDPAAVAAYQKALAAARDTDQVERIAKKLKELKHPIDLTRQFGFITRWKLIGPFDNHGGGGFAAVYPPEKAVDLAATLPGKAGKPLRWLDHTTTKAYGQVDLNAALGKHMGAVGYGFAAVNAPRAMPVEVRVTSNNAVKIFLNGQEIFRREEYHHGVRMDQHVGRGQLRPGRNEVLVKICQNEQTEDWAQSWFFQARLCDALGGKLPVEVIEEKSGSVEKGGR